MRHDTTLLLAVAGGGGGERPIPSLLLTPLDLLSQLV